MTADEIRLLAWQQAAANMQKLLANVAEEVVAMEGEGGAARKFLQNCVDRISEAGFWFEKASAAMSPLQLAPANQVLS